MPLLRPSLDPDLAPWHSKLINRASIATPEGLAARRARANITWEIVSEGYEDRISHTEIKIPTPNGPIKAVILRFKKSDPNKTTPRAPLIHFHGGGFIICTRFHALNAIFGIIEELDLVVISPEFRPAPEHPQPAQVEDGYATLLWVAEHSEDLGVDANKIILGGGSAGGNLSVGVSLLSKHRFGPSVFANLLFYPWLEDDNSAFPLHQFGDIPPWTKEDNAVALNYQQSKICGGPPPTYIDVGEVDGFRDQAINFARKLWASGVQTELHVWPGAWHGFDTYAPEVEVSRRARRTRIEWLGRLLRSTS
ncbi:Alpha/Beta hydrolase protein [Aspergillus karnatakaensis]|uniref:alpha/beta hydrolase n=1 Tax=Aspergillus karnatakaensis TaxID=1810916 RepID=UPI003CCCC717